MEDGLERRCRRRDPIRIICRGQNRPRSEVAPPPRRLRRICKEHEKQSGPFVVANVMPRCHYAARNLPSATYFSLKGPPLLPGEAFARSSRSSRNCAAGWQHRAGNGLPFARCQILPKVDEMEEEGKKRREGGRKDGDARRPWRRKRKGTRPK